MNFFKKVLSGVFLSSLGVSAVAASADDELQSSNVALSERPSSEVSQAGKGEQVSETEEIPTSSDGSFADDWRVAEQCYKDASAKLLMLRDTVIATQLKSDLDNARARCSSSNEASARVTYRQEAFAILAKVDRYLGLQEINDAEIARRKEETDRRNAEELKEKEAKAKAEMEKQRNEIDDSIYKIREKQLQAKLDEEKYKAISDRLELLKERLAGANTLEQMRECWNIFDGIKSDYDASLREQYRRDEEKLLKELESFKKDNSDYIEAMKKRIGEVFSQKSFERRNKAYGLVGKLSTLLEKVKSPSDMISYNEEFIRCRSQFDALEEEEKQENVKEAQGKLKMEDFEMIVSKPDEVERRIREGTLDFNEVIIGQDEAKKALIDYLNNEARYMDRSAVGFRPSRGLGEMLYGPGGLGKTALARYAVASAGWRLNFIRSGEWVGRGIVAFQEYLEKLRDAVYRTGKKTVFFLDDAEKLLAPGSSFAGFFRAFVDSELAKGKDSLIRFIITTNHPEILEPTLFRQGRIPGRIVLRLLYLKEFERIFRRNCAFFASADGVDFIKVAGWCVGRTPAFAMGLFLKVLEIAGRDIPPDVVTYPPFKQEYFDEAYEIMVKESNDGDSNVVW